MICLFQNTHDHTSLWHDDDDKMLAEEHTNWEPIPLKFETGF